MTRHSCPKILTIVAAASLLLALNSSGFSQSNSDRSRVRDVALQSDGAFSGRTVGREGQLLGGQLVSLWHNRRELARTQSTADGVFSFRDLRPGHYQIMTTDDIVNCRLWATNTAPPAAQNAIVLYSGSIVRGQCGCSETTCSTCVSFQQEVVPASARVASGGQQVRAVGYQKGAVSQKGVVGGGGGDACYPGYQIGCCPPGGGLGGGGCFGTPLLRNHRLLVVGGLIGAAVAIPLALSDDDSSGS